MLLYQSLPIPFFLPSKNSVSQKSTPYPLNTYRLLHPFLVFSPLPSSPIASTDGPCRRQLTSTPLAGVSKIASNFCKLSSATLSSGTFAANRKRKSSAPVFSTRMPPNFNNPNAAIPRSSFMSLVTNKVTTCPYYFYKYQFILEETVGIEDSQFRLSDCAQSRDQPTTKTFTKRGECALPPANGSTPIFIPKTH